MVPAMSADLFTRRDWWARAVPVAAGCWSAAHACGAAGTKAVVAPFRAGDIVEYGKLPKPMKRLYDIASALTRRELGYTFGSCDPARGGMDCSGTIHHTLVAAGVKAPRSSYDQYVWAREAGTLREIPGRVPSLADPALRDLRPGNLLFWEGTYETGKRQPPISHVMIFLGTLKSDGQPVLFGASSGRSFRGRRIHGVSAFDFHLPGPKSSSRLVAYARVPGLE